MSRTEELFEKWVEARLVDGNELDVAELAGGDARLTGRLEELIASFRAIDEVLPSPSRPAGLVQEGERQPPRLERYEVQELLGEGGMGEVWDARQVAPIKRPVALKVIKRGLDTAQVIQRFESERQALASMNHAAIARVFDAGATDDGRPYFAMEKVEGTAITECCDRLGLSIRRRLELFVRVCDGVHHAHQKGIIHRDLKPSNVLVKEDEGELHPKIIDFGISKAVNADPAAAPALTQLGQVVGTPAYMSPEQADMTGLDIDTRSDVYSLGILLYELLVGVRPFADRPLSKAPRADRPPTPSSRISSLGEAAGAVAALRGSKVPTISRTLKGELDWIVLKALDPEKERRYDSAAQLANDLRRFFRREPVLAGPPGAGYQLRKFISRHRVVFAVGVALVLAVVSAVGGLAVGLERALEAEERALAESRLAEGVADFLAELFERSDPTSELGEPMSVHELLDRGAARIGEELVGQPRVQARLLETMGRAYRGLGDYAAAASLLEQAVELRRREEGPESLGVARAHFELAEIRIFAGEFDKGEVSAQRAFDIRRRQLPESSLDMAECFNQLGMLRWRQGRYDEALELQEKALRVKEQLLGPEHGDLAKVLNNTAVLRWEAGDLEGARAYMERGLALFRRDLGPEHPNVAANLNNLGLVAEREDDFEASAAYHRRALAIREATMEPNHPYIAESLNNLGTTLQALGEYGEAREVYERAIDIRRQALGDSHPELASTLGNLGNLFADMGELEEARRFIHQAHEMFLQNLGPDHPYLAYVLDWLASLDRREGQLDDAERRLRRCWQVRRQALDAYHPLVLKCTEPLAEILRQRGESAESEELEALAAEIRRLHDM